MAWETWKFRIVGSHPLNMRYLTYFSLPTLHAFCGIQHCASFLQSWTRYQPGLSCHIIQSWDTWWDSQSKCKIKDLTVDCCNIRNCIIRTAERYDKSQSRIHVKAKWKLFVDSMTLYIFLIIHCRPTAVFYVVSINSIKH